MLKRRIQRTINKIVAVVSAKRRRGLAEFERHLILTRTEEAWFVRRQPMLTKHQRDEVLARIAEGETLTAMVRSYNVSHMTISRPAAATFMQLDHAIFGSVTEHSGVGV